MAQTSRSGVKPPSKWRCLVEGCPLEGVWQEVTPGEEYIADTTDPRSHYWREHYLATEAEYLRKLAEQKAERMEHYRLTGKLLPPKV